MKHRFRITERAARRRAGLGLLAEFTVSEPLSLASARPDSRGWLAVRGPQLSGIPEPHSQPDGAVQPLLHDGRGCLGSNTGMSRSLGLPQPRKPKPHPLWGNNIYYRRGPGLVRERTHPQECKSAVTGESRGDPLQGRGGESI